MGLLNSFGIGIGAAANAAQPFIMNMQQAEIQKLRDERMAEIAKGSADYASKLSLENEQTIYDRKLAREPEETSREIAKKGLLTTSAANLEDQRRNDPAYLKGVAAEAAAKHIESPDLNAGLRAEQIKAAKLSNEQAQMLVDKRNAWMNEQNPVKKAKLADEYQALTGKDPDKFAPVMGKDDNGNPVFLGSFDTKNNQFTSASDLANKGSTSVMDKLKGVDPENGKPGAASTTTQPSAASAAQKKMSIQQVDQELKKMGEPMMGWSDAMTKRRKDLLKLRTSLLGNQ